jgi:hypothetical protein
MLFRSDGSRGTDMSERADALAERIFGSLLGTMEVFTIYLGDRLGLYAALAEGVAATSADVASRAGIAERLPIEADLWRFYRLHP